MKVLGVCTIYFGGCGYGQETGANVCEVVWSGVTFRKMNLIICVKEEKQLQWLLLQALPAYYCNCSQVLRILV